MKKMMVISRFATESTERRPGPPVVPFYPVFGEGSPTKIDYRKKGCSYSNLSTGGPRRCVGCILSRGRALLPLPLQRLRLQ